MHMGSFFFDMKHMVSWSWMYLILRSRTLQQGRLFLTRGYVPEALWLKGGPFRLPHHSASLNANSRERFKKDFVDLCIRTRLDLGLMFMCAEIRLQQCSRLSFFLHVCSTCSSHISANIYTGCKTLLISLPCLLSCSFSQPTLTLTFFHPDGE